MTSFENDIDTPGGVQLSTRIQKFEVRVLGHVCCGCGHVLTSSGFDIVEPRLVRAVCQSCHHDLFAIEFA